VAVDKGAIIFKQEIETPEEEESNVANDTVEDISKGCFGSLLIFFGIISIITFSLWFLLTIIII